MTEKTLDDFVEELYESGEHCFCNATSAPPCSFCEGGAEEMAKELYEEYLDEEEEEQ